MSHDERIGAGVEVGAALALGRPQAGRSLDLSTQLGEPGGEVEQDCGWWLSTFAECAEASLAWLYPSAPFSVRGVPDRVRAERAAEHKPVGSPNGALRMSADGEVYRDESWGADWVGVDADVRAAEREAFKWKQSNGRAAARSRRYFVRNKLRYMWVLTFAQSRWERAGVMAEVSEFTRRLRTVLGRKAFPYWYSPELHPGGHGWHVNLFVPMYIDKDTFDRAWGHGFTWVTDFEKDTRGPKGEPLGLCRTPREGWRRAAQYGCKYSQKDWSPEHVGRANHRYEIAQRFAPAKVSRWVSGKAEAEGIVNRMIPADGWDRVKVWDSGDSIDWNRPPARTWRW